MKIKWMKILPVYFVISALFLIPGVFSLIRWGLKPSIDFTGGTLMEISTALSQQEVTNTVTRLNLDLRSVKQTSNDSYLLRFKYLENQRKDEIINSLNQETDQEVQLIRWESLGPSLGKELLIKTGVGIAIALLAILLYINIRFKDKSFGICAVLAMLHDSLILLGSFSLLGYFLGVEVDSLFVTAILTTLSFSVHDTVVVYDQIRELRDLNPKKEFEKIANSAINQTLARSINNSLTIMFMLIALVIFGGQTIKWFATALLIGTIAGTYSSTFTAIPLLVVWHKLFKN
jgi:preprotein translocase subunit SecF